jgi:hypothetical protein
MSFRLPIIVGLVVLAVSVSFTGAPRASAQTLPPVTPIYAPFGSGYLGYPAYAGYYAGYSVSFPTGGAGVNSQYEPGGPQPDDCWLYDSWCGYCYRWPSADQCMQHPPDVMHPSALQQMPSH